MLRCNRNWRRNDKLEGNLATDGGIGGEYPRMERDVDGGKGGDKRARGVAFGPIKQSVRAARILDISWATLRRFHEYTSTRTS